MMRVILKSLAVAALLNGVSVAHAQDYTAMLPSQLFEAATEAIDTNDRRELMTIMKEIQARELVWFKPVRAAQCDYKPDPQTFDLRETGVNTRGAWTTWTYSKRLEEQSCDCAAGVGTIEDMVTELIGKDVGQLVDEDFALLSTWNLRNQSREKHPTVIEYNAFFAATCRS